MTYTFTPTQQEAIIRLRKAWLAAVNCDTGELSAKLREIEKASQACVRAGLDMDTILKAREVLES